MKVLGRWLGIVAASVLFGGFVLLAQLRAGAGAARRTATTASSAAVALLRALAPVAWLLVVLAAIEGVFAGASSGTGDGLDFGLLTASATGVSDLVRAIVVALLSLALVPARQPPRLRDALCTSAAARRCC